MPKGQWSQMPGQTFILHPPWVSSFEIPSYYGRPNHWERALTQQWVKNEVIFPSRRRESLANGGVPGNWSRRRVTTAEADINNEVGRDRSACREGWAETHRVWGGRHDRQHRRLTICYVKS